MNVFPGVAPLAQGGEPTRVPPPLVSRTPQLLWRPQTFRVDVVGLLTKALYANRSLVVALEIYADSNNTTRVLIGNKNVTTTTTSPDGVPGNNYFQLDPGRHVYIWTDKPEIETFDVSMYFAAQELPLATQYLHCTQWQPQPLA